MQKFFNKKIIIILSLITFVVVIIALFTKPATPLPQIVSTSPISNSRNVNYFDPIIIKFDQKVDPARISIASLPEEKWSINLSDNNSIILNHAQYFRVDTKYTLDIFYDEQLLSTLAFTTIHQQSDPRYVQSVVKQMEEEYPLATKIPFENSSFLIKYTSPLTISITIKNPSLTSQEIIDEVKSWVKSSGGDVDAHKYIIATPEN